MAMPHIRIRALNENTVKALSSELPKELALILNTPIDNFSVEKVHTEFYKDGIRVDGDPMIEVFWFDRGQKVQDECAQKITELVAQHFKVDYISVVFTNLPKESYYENGKHF